MHRGGARPRDWVSGCYVLPLCINLRPGLRCIGWVILGIAVSGVDVANLMKGGIKIRILRGSDVRSHQWRDI
jgi:hypothetical protein